MKKEYSKEFWLARDLQSSAMPGIVDEIWEFESEPIYDGFVHQDLTGKDNPENLSRVWLTSKGLNIKPEERICIRLEVLKRVKG